MTTYVPTGKPRGFATMDPEQQRAIASKGGKAAHVAGTAHNWRNDPQGAAEAGRKGGSVSKRGRAGFAVMEPEKHHEAARKGGATSRKTKKTVA